LFFFHSFAQKTPVSPMNDTECSSRRAQFIQMMQNRAGANSAVDQAVSTQQPAEGVQLETTRQAMSDDFPAAVNWENMILKDGIEVLCRDLGMEFVISPSVDVSQEVSVRAGDATSWNVADKQELFDAIIETAGVQRGRAWAFSPSATKKKLPQPPIDSSVSSNFFSLSLWVSSSDSSSSA
jgi:hypothetical protein